MEIATQGLLVEHGIVVAIFIVLARAVLLRLLLLTELQILERNEILEGRQRPGIVSRDIEHLSPATKDIAYQVSIRMAQYAPSIDISFAMSARIEIRLD